MHILFEATTSVNDAELLQEILTYNHNMLYAVIGGFGLSIMLLAMLVAFQFWKRM